MSADTIANTSEPAMQIPTHDVTELTRLMNARYSCRGYLPEPLDRACIRSIVQLAGRSASWCNVEPWQLVITEHPESTDRFRDALMELPLRDGLRYERWMQHRYRTQSAGLEQGVQDFVSARASAAP